MKLQIIRAIFDDGTIQDLYDASLFEDIAKAKMDKIKYLRRRAETWANIEPPI